MPKVDATKLEFDITLMKIAASSPSDYSGDKIFLKIPFHFRAIVGLHKNIN